MNWSPEMESTLVSMVNEGATQSQILAVLNPKFGKTYTRSAIAGKMNRMGLKSKSGLKAHAPATRTNPARPAPKKPRQSKSSAVKPPPVRRKFKPVPAANFGRGVSLENLRDSQCRFPINSVDTAKNGLRFCGQLADKSAASAQARAYCAAHAERALTSPSDRHNTYLKSLDTRAKYLK